MDRANKPKRGRLGSLSALPLEKKLAAADGLDYGRTLAARLKRREQQHLRQSEREAVFKTARQHQHLAECLHLALQVLGRARVAPPAGPARTENVPQLEDRTSTDAVAEEDLSDLLQIAHFARLHGWELECEQMLERLIAAYPDRAFGFLGMGLLRMDQGRYPPARACFELVLRQTPGNALARVWLGMAMLGEGRIAAAAEMLVGLLDHDGAAGELARATMKVPELAHFVPRPAPVQMALRTSSHLVPKGNSK
jgi:tetratricopeptide (TPR) repeat protein